MKKRNLLNLSAWLISGLATAVVFIAWGNSYGWNFSRISAYQLFPLFGLAAFALMWSHYVVSVARQVVALDRSVIKTYFEATSFLVLLAIFLHPGLLVWQLWRDGQGLPPSSYYTYVAPGMRFFVTLGVISLLIFLAYELRRLYERKTWWKYVGYLTDAAMIAIFYHGLQLGSQLGGGWFRAVWFFFGLTLFACLLYMHVPKIQKLSSSHQKL